MKLRKAQKEEYKDLIRSSDSKKLLTIGETQEIKWAWEALCYDHFGKLRLELEHISNYKLCDMLRSDVLNDGTRLFDTQSYFRHYSDFEIAHIAAEIRKAQKDLLYLQALAETERDRRRKG